MSLRNYFKKKPIVICLVILLLIPFGIFSPVKVYAAEISHAFVEQTTEQTHTGDSDWTDITGASLADTNFVEGGKYLLIFNGMINGDNANNVFGIRAVHGSTAFTGSNFQFETAHANTNYKYLWFTVWTAVASEGVKLQFVNIDSTSTTVSADTVTISAIRLDADLTEGVDWHYNEHASNDAAITIATADHADGDSHLILATQQIPEASTSQQHVSNLVRSGEASNTAPIVQNEGEDTTNGIIVHYMANVYDLGASDNTFTVTETGLGSRSFNNVFSLNLEKFKVNNYSYLEDEVALSDTDWATLIRTLTFDLSGEDGARDSLIIGYFVGDHNAASRWIQSRLQIANTDQPTGQSDFTFNAQSWDELDEINQGIITLENLTASSHTIDLDGDTNFLTNTPAAEDRLLVAFTMELASGGSTAHTKSLTEDHAMQDSISRLGTYGRSLTEDHANQDSISRLATYGRSLNEAHAHQDSVVRVLDDGSLADSLTEDHAMQDSVSFVCTGTCGGSTITETGGGINPLLIEQIQSITNPPIKNIQTYVWQPLALVGNYATTHTDLLYLIYVAIVISISSYFILLYKKSRKNRTVKSKYPNLPKSKLQNIPNKISYQKTKKPNFPKKPKQNVPKKIKR